MGLATVLVILPASWNEGTEEGTEEGTVWQAMCTRSRNEDSFRSERAYEVGKAGVSARASAALTRRPEARSQSWAARLWTVPLAVH